MASAQVYRCVDPKSKAVTYSGTPCVTGDQNKVSITENAITEGSKLRQENARGQTEGHFSYDTDGAVGASPDATSNARGSAEQRNRLAAECARGISRSCATLRML